MAIKYGKFELPTVIKIDGQEDTKEMRFIAEPFEKGFAHTIGNSLRRVLLSSIEAPAIISVKIEDVAHEYMSIDGVVEDMTDIILNLKGVLLKHFNKNLEEATNRIYHLTSVLDITSDKLKEGQFKVYLKDIISDPQFELVNPDHYLFTVTKPMSKRIDLKVQIGRGYAPSERHVIENKVNDEIVVDSIYSPVRKVNYYVENTRVGRDTDFDRLILEITTDGRVTPKEALNFAAQIVEQHLAPFTTLKTQQIVFETGETQAETDRDVILQKLVLRVGEIELSVRSTNCLAGAGIETIGELVLMPEPELLKFRNFGRKSLTEIKQKLHEMGLGLGMDLSRFEINKDNIKEVLEDYKMRRAGGNHEAS
ncbi:MAG: DNA-directed RNA polymerase subunit alpha [Chlamydiae bacterium]|nr:DNA-directed RNA polymerase subunit alpha [Chlamydiota bacterium]